MRYLLSLTFITFLLFPSLSFGFDQDDLDKLKATNECVGCNLSGANLSYANLSGANLNRADLRGANLFGINLHRANLEGAYLNKANLNKANLNKANLSGADLSETYLFEANLRGANLSGADLSFAILTGATLTGANLEGANLANIKNPPKIITNELKRRKPEEEKRKAEEERKAEEKRKEEAALNPGFKDIKPGLTKDEIYEVSKCRLSTYPKECYGLDNIKFRGQFSKDVLNTLYVDLGPIVQSSGILYTLNEYLGSDSGNIYTKLYQSFKSKYKLAYEFNERDRQLFNEGEKTDLYAVFEDGQVALHIEKIKKDYSSKLNLTVEYRDKDRAKNFVKNTKPKRASSDDF